jgi:hypothetical protein
VGVRQKRFLAPGASQHKVGLRFGATLLAFPPFDFGRAQGRGPFLIRGIAAAERNEPFRLGLWSACQFRRGAAAGQRG